MALNTLNAGAQDYLVKGKITGEAIRKTVRYSLERKKLEESLLDAGRHWKNTFDTIDDSILLMDIDGNIIKCNPATERLLWASMQP